jgi:hypothetical protein
MIPSWYSPVLCLNLAEKLVTTWAVFGSSTVPPAKRSRAYCHQSLCYFHGTRAELSRIEVYLMLSRPGNHARSGRGVDGMIMSKLISDLKSSWLSKYKYLQGIITDSLRTNGKPQHVLPGNSTSSLSSQPRSYVSSTRPPFTTKSDANSSQRSHIRTKLLLTANI